MLIRQIIELVAGIGLVGLSLRDVFDTVVVPGESRGALRVGRLLFAMLPLWKRMRRGKTGVSTSFAPSVLMASFVVWMTLLLVGFGLIAHGLGNWFSPHADSFEQAAFIAGSALATVGLSGIEAYGPAHWVLVAAGTQGSRFAAVERNPTTPDFRDHTKTIEFILKDPIRVVERRIRQRGQHGLQAKRQGRFSGHGGGSL